MSALWELNESGVFQPKLVKELLYNSICCFVAVKSKNVSKYFSSLRRSGLCLIEEYSIRCNPNSRNEQMFIICRTTIFGSKVTFCCFRSTCTDMTTMDFYRDWLTNLRIRGVQKLNGKYHSGFSCRAETFEFKGYLEDLLKKGERVVLCGHSQGGAVAKTVFLDLITDDGFDMDYIRNQKLLCVGYGSPFIFDQNLARYISGDRLNQIVKCMYDFIFDNDLIPALVAVADFYPLGNYYFVTVTDEGFVIKLSVLSSMKKIEEIRKRVRNTAIPNVFAPFSTYYRQLLDHDPAMVLFILRLYMSPKNSYEAVEAKKNTTDLDKKKRIVLQKLRKMNEETNGNSNILGEGNIMDITDSFCEVHYYGTKNVELGRVRSDLIKPTNLSYNVRITKEGTREVLQITLFGNNLQHFDEINIKNPGIIPQKETGIESHVKSDTEPYSVTLKFLCCSTEDDSIASPIGQPVKTKNKKRRVDSSSWKQYFESKTKDEDRKVVLTFQSSKVVFKEEIERDIDCTGSLNRCHGTSSLSEFIFGSLSQSLMLPSEHAKPLVDLLQVMFSFSHYRLITYEEKNHKKFWKCSYYLTLLRYPEHDLTLVEKRYPKLLQRFKKKDSKEKEEYYEDVLNFFYQYGYENIPDDMGTLKKSKHEKFKKAIHRCDWDFLVGDYFPMDAVQPNFHNLAEYVKKKSIRENKMLQKMENEEELEIDGESEEDLHISDDEDWSDKKETKATGGKKEEEEDGCDEETEAKNQRKMFFEFSVFCHAMLLDFKKQLTVLKDHEDPSGFFSYLGYFLKKLDFMNMFSNPYRKVLVDMDYERQLDDILHFFGKNEVDDINCKEKAVIEISDSFAEVLIPFLHFKKKEIMEPKEIKQLLWSYGAIEWNFDKKRWRLWTLNPYSFQADVIDMSVLKQMKFGKETMKKLQQAPEIAMLFLKWMFYVRKINELRTTIFKNEFLSVFGGVKVAKSYLFEGCFKESSKLRNAQFHTRKFIVREVSKDLDLGKGVKKCFVVDSPGVETVNLYRMMFADNARISSKVVIVLEAKRASEVKNSTGLSLARMLLERGCKVVILMNHVDTFFEALADNNFAKNKFDHYPEGYDKKAFGKFRRAGMMLLKKKREKVKEVVVKGLGLRKNNLHVFFTCFQKMRRTAVSGSSKYLELMDLSDLDLKFWKIKKQGMRYSRKEKFDDVGRELKKQSLDLLDQNKIYLRQGVRLIMRSYLQDDQVGCFGRYVGSEETTGRTLNVKLQEYVEQEKCDEYKIGFFNEAMNCYVNSSLQVLINLNIPWEYEKILKQMEAAEETKLHDFHQSVCQLLGALQYKFNRKSHVNMRSIEVLQRFENLENHYGGGAWDASHFLNRFLMNSSCRHTHLPSKAMYCTSCKTVTGKIEQSSAVYGSGSVRFVGEKKGSDEDYFNSLLDGIYTSQKNMICRKCNKSRKHVMCLNTTGSVLIVKAPVFRSLGAENRKIRSRVLPESLETFTAFGNVGRLGQDVPEIIRKHFKPHKMKLQAVVYHQGPGIDTGSSGDLKSSSDGHFFTVKKIGEKYVECNCVPIKTKVVDGIRGVLKPDFSKTDLEDGYSGVVPYFYVFVSEGDNLWIGEGGKDELKKPRIREPCLLGNGGVRRMKKPRKREKKE